MEIAIFTRALGFSRHFGFSYGRFWYPRICVLIFVAFWAAYWYSNHVIVLIVLLFMVIHWMLGFLKSYDCCYMFQQMGLVILIRIAVWIILACWSEEVASTSLPSYYMVCGTRKMVMEVWITMTIWRLKIVLELQLFFSIIVVVV